MTVTAQYAQAHFEELLDSAERGEPVEILREGRPSAKIITLPAPAARKPIVLGAGRGELVPPTDEEWQQMKAEDEHSFANHSLMTTGEI